MDLLYRVKTFFTALRGNHYTWPAIDISLPGNRHFHLIGSIHMGSRDMAPLPAKLLKKLNHADALMFPVTTRRLLTFLHLPHSKNVSARSS